MVACGQYINGGESIIDENEKDEKKSKKWLFVPAFGILSAVFLFLAIGLSGGGDGYVMPGIIILWPLLPLIWLVNILSFGNGAFFFIYIAPLHWMGEATLALCRNKYCKWAFLLVVPGRYIYTLIVILLRDDCFHSTYKAEFGFLLSIAIFYIAVQLLLWFLFLKTWDLWKPFWKK